MASEGYRAGLVDLANWADQPRDLRQRGDLPGGAGARLRPRLAVCRAREPDPEPRRLFRLGHGRGIGDPVPRPGRRGSRLPQFVPASRHEGVPLRRGQYAVFTCPYHGWSYGTDGRLVGVPYFREAYHSSARPVAMGPRRGGAARPLQGHGMGQLGPGGAVLPRISRRFPPLSRPDARRLGRQRGRQRGPGRHAEMAHAVQLEVPGREFLRRQLPQYQPPLGRSGRDRPLAAAAGATCRSGCWRAGCRSASPSAATRPGSMCCRRTSRPRPPTSIRRSSPNISGIARQSAGDGAANGAG